MTDKKTYILAGYDSYPGNKNALKAQIAEYAKRGDVEVIRAKPGEPFSEAIKKIKSPANVVLACHGSNEGKSLGGGFAWNAEEYVDYQNVYELLPKQGIGFIQVVCCKGGSYSPNIKLDADNWFNIAGVFKNVPHGAVVFSEVGRQALGWGGDFAAQKARATKSTDSAVDIFLVVLNATDPKAFAQWQKEFAPKEKILPVDVLPSTLVIGGDWPDYINLRSEADALAVRGAQGELKEDGAFKRAITRVQKSFHEAVFAGIRNSTPSSDAFIAQVGAKIASGKPAAHQNAAEMRVAYALAAAYLEESGEMGKRVARAQSGKWYDPERLAKFSDEGFDEYKKSTSLSGLGKHFLSMVAEGMPIYQDQMIPLQRQLKASGLPVDVNGVMNCKTADAIVSIAVKYHIVSNAIDFTNPRDAENILFQDALRKEEALYTAKKVGAVLDKAGLQPAASELTRLEHGHNASAAGKQGSYRG